MVRSVHSACPRDRRDRSGESLTLKRLVAVGLYQSGRSQRVVVPVRFAVLYGSIFGSTGMLTVDANGPDDIRCKIALPTAVARASRLGVPGLGGQVEESPR